MVEEYKYKETTGKIIGAAMQVHKVLGNGFPDDVRPDGDELFSACSGEYFRADLECDVPYLFPWFDGLSVLDHHKKRKRNGSGHGDYWRYPANFIKCTQSNYVEYFPESI